MLRPAERQPFQNPGHWCAYARGAGYQSSGFTSIGHQANDRFLAPGQPADRTDAGIRHNKGSPLSPVFSMLSKKQERRPMRMINVPTKTAVMVVAVALILMASDSQGAQCGSAGGGFEGWKRQFAEEARGKGITASAVSALMATTYSTATIAADRNQGSFRLSLDQFLAKRGGAAIVARGRALKQSNAALFASIQQRYGVPPGPLLAIWGMETGFGAVRGNQSALSAVATLAYDCRRSALFTEHLNAALTLVDRGVLSANTRGSMHGEIGQTQFLPKAILNYAGGGSLDTPA